MTEPVEIAYQGKKRAVAIPAKLEEEPPLRGMGPRAPSEIDTDTDETDADGEPHPPRAWAYRDRG